MNDKAAVLEAVKRKRAALQYEKEDASNDHDADDGELAPDGEMNKGSDHDALLGKPDGDNSEEKAESPDEENNQTEAGQAGFPAVSHSSPANSKNKFVNVKKDSHDPVDLNHDRNMAGREGESNQYDEMGVKPHLDVRKQSSQMAKHNAVKDEGLKDSLRKDVKGKMAMPDVVPSHGEDAGDAVAAINSDNPSKLTGMKSARSKLDGFLSKIKTNRAF